jgi:hypothetical protein
MTGEWRALFALPAHEPWVQSRPLCSQIINIYRIDYLTINELIRGNTSPNPNSGIPPAAVSITTMRNPVDRLIRVMMFGVGVVGLLLYVVFQL